HRRRGGWGEVRKHSMRPAAPTAGVDRTGFCRDGLAPVPSAHRSKSVALRWSQPLRVHGAVFRRLRRVPDVIAPPADDAPRSRPARSHALSVDRVALNAGYQSRISATRNFRRYYGSDPSEFRARAQRDSSDSATPTEEAIEEPAAA